MTCPTQETLHTFLDGVLPPAQADPIAQHLSSCAACASEARKVRRLAAALGTSRATSSCLGPAKIACFSAGQLDETTHAEVLVHLGRCRKCADALMTLRNAVPRRSKTPTSVPAARPVPRPAARTLAAPRRGDGWAWVAAAALILAAIGTGAWIARRQDASQGQGTQAARPNTPVRQEPSTPPTQVVQQPPSEPKQGPSEEPRREVVQAPPAPEPPRPPQPPEQEHASKPPEPPPYDPAPPTAPKEVPYQVACMLGPVEVQPSGKATWQPLREGQPLDTIGRTMLRAGGSKAARIACAGNSINLEKGAEVSVVVDERGSWLVLLHGGLLLESHGVDEGETACEVAGVRIAVKGRRVAASIDRKQGRVIALDGELTVYSGGKSVTLARGLAATWLEGKPPSDPSKADLAGALAWEKELEVYLSAVAGQGKAQPPMRLVPDSKTTGGSYATCPPRERGAGSLEFTMDVKRAATYRLLVRATTGERPKGAYAVSVDGGAPRELGVHDRGEEWVWSAIEGIELPAGPHVIRFADPQGGLRLDSITLTTDALFHPEPMAEEHQGEAPPAGGGQGGGQRPGHGNPGGDGRPGPGGRK